MKKRYFKKVLMLVTLFVAVMLSSCGNEESSGQKSFGDSIEKAVAYDYLIAVHEGNAEEVCALTSIEYIASTNVETYKVYMHKVSQYLENMLKEIDTWYGKKWKYNINIIDSYPSKGWSMIKFGEYTAEEYREVLAEIEYTGKVFLFFKHTNKIEIKVILERVGDEWFVRSDAMRDVYNYLFN